MMEYNWTSNDFAWFNGDSSQYTEELNACILRKLQANTPVEYFGELYFPIERAIIDSKPAIYQEMLKQGFYSQLNDDEKLKVLRTALSCKEREITDTLSKDLSTDAIFTALSSQELFDDAHGVSSQHHDTTTQDFLITFITDKLEAAKEIVFPSPDKNLSTLLKTLIFKESTLEGDLAALKLFSNICQKAIGIDLSNILYIVYTDHNLIIDSLSLQKDTFCTKLVNDPKVKLKALEYWKTHAAEASDEFVSQDTILNLFS